MKKLLTCMEACERSANESNVHSTEFKFVNESDLYVFKMIIQTLGLEDYLYVDKDENGVDFIRVYEAVDIVEQNNDGKIVVTSLGELANYMRQEQVECAKHLFEDVLQHPVERRKKFW